MGDNLTPTQRAVRERSKAGDVMYEGQPAGDDLFEDEPGKLATIESLNWSMTGVTIDRELTEDEWLGIVQDIRKIKRAYLWMLADLLVYAIERGYGDTHGKYEKVSELTGYTAESLQNYASVARGITISRRRENLSFSHHTEVVPLTADEQVYWLEQAAVNRWSAKRLRAEIAKAWASQFIVGQTVFPDKSDDEPTPLPDENEEEATDKEFPPSPMNDDENWQSLNYLKTIARKKDYENIDEQRAKIIRKQIATARQFLVLLETYLPHSSRK